jgi:hypothetical protein
MRITSTILPMKLCSLAGANALGTDDLFDSCRWRWLSWKDGMYAIGSGRDAAISTLFLLEHKISSPLYEAIYSVATAKFSSEAHGIGKHTTMCVMRKQMPEDADESATRILNQPDEIKKLRELWEAHGGSPRQTPNTARS